MTGTGTSRGVTGRAGTRLVIARTGRVPSQVLMWLAGAVVLLAAAAAGTGLLWAGSGAPFPFLTTRGETVQIFGRGLYANDTLLQVGANWGADVVALVAGIPLLVVAGLLYRRRSLRGHLLLIGAFGFFVYYGASYALGVVAYNDLFLVYTALFSAALFGLILALVDFQPGRMALRANLPRRVIGWFMLGSGLATAVIWLMDPVAALIAGHTPGALGAQTTLFTHAFDVAVIVPAAFIAGAMILRDVRFGYAIAFALLVLEVALLPMIAVSTYAQLRLGISFTAAEIAGPIAGFTVLAGAATWVMVTALRGVADRPDPVLRLSLN